MSKKAVTTLATLAVAVIFILSAQSLASAQGRGRGGGGGGGVGRGSGMGSGNPGIGRPDGVGVERGTSTSSGRSDGRADSGRNTASVRSNSRSDEGISRARLQRENARRAEEELREHPKMAARLHMTANDLRAGYQAALAANPRLKFGEYVAASRLAANLGERYPGVTRTAILEGLAQDKSIGQTLQDLGVSERQAKEAKKHVEREIKEARRP